MFAMLPMSWPACGSGSGRGCGGCVDGRLAAAGVGGAVELGGAGGGGDGELVVLVVVAVALPGAGSAWLPGASAPLAAALDAASPAASTRLFTAIALSSCCPWQAASRAAARAAKDGDGFTLRPLPDSPHDGNASKPYPDSRQQTPTARIITGRAREASGVAEGTLKGDAHIGRELRDDLVAQPQTRLGRGDARADAEL